ncbi:DUF5129 domain-containing protein [Pseudomonas donghuensis]
MAVGNLWEPVSGVFWATAPSILDGSRWIADLNGSSFFITVFGALVGAFAGAWAAQRSAKNGKRRDELATEIRVVNAGIILSHAIFESVLSAQVEYIGPAKDRYEAERDKYLKALESPPVSGEILINFNLQRFPELPTPVDQLQPLILQQGSTPALRAIVALVESSGLLHEAINLRNVYLDKFERKEIPPGFSYPDVYFGLAAKDGHHQHFSSVVAAISLYGDDVVYYSRRLCEHLSQHGKILKKELKKISGEPVGIVEFNFVEVDKKGLCPPQENYKGWEGGYVEEHQRHRWWRWWCK